MKKLNLYSLQFADSLKIKQHHIVYLFNETGAGKTLTAGMSVLNEYEHEYEQYNFSKNKPMKVLVITVSDVVARQFRNEWENMLPFGEKYEYYIQADYINHHHSNIRKCTDKYNLVIIDEAHTMINQETLRYSTLKEIKAEKVIFMTATPVRYGEESLEAYYSLGCDMMRKSACPDEISAKKLEAYNQEHFLPSNLDLNFPVSRYMKDTVERAQSHTVTVLKRAEPIIKKCENRFIGAAEAIKEQLEKGNRCLVFVDTVNGGHSQLNLLKETLIKKFSLAKEDITDIPADRKEELKAFDVNSDAFNPESKIPYVLIVTKFAEAGVNLSAFNRIVHVSLPGVSSTIEQRFGRIDRILTKNGEKNLETLYGKSIKELDIASVFICCNKTVTTSNFDTALNSFVSDCLSFLPSRNIMLTRDILNLYDEFNIDCTMKRLTSDDIKNAVNINWEQEPGSDFEILCCDCDYDITNSVLTEFFVWVNSLGIKKLKEKEKWELEKEKWELELTTDMMDLIIDEDVFKINTELKNVRNKENLKGFLVKLYEKLQENSQTKKKLRKNLSNFKLQNIAAPWNNVFYNNRKNAVIPEIQNVTLSDILKDLQNLEEYQKFSGAFDAYIGTASGKQTVPPGFYTYDKFSKRKENWNLKISETAVCFLEHVRISQGNIRNEYETHLEPLKIYVPLYVWYILFMHNMTENLPEFIEKAIFVHLARKFGGKTYKDTNIEEIILKLNNKCIPNISAVEGIFENWQVSDLESKIIIFCSLNHEKEKFLQYFCYAVDYTNRHNHEISVIDMFCAYAKFYKENKNLYYWRNNESSIVYGLKRFIFTDLNENLRDLRKWFTDFSTEE